MFVCTDRGRHKQTRFGDFTISADGSLHVHVHPSSLTMPNSKAGPGEGFAQAFSLLAVSSYRAGDSKAAHGGNCCCARCCGGDTIVIDVSKALS